MTDHGQNSAEYTSHSNLEIDTASDLFDDTGTLITDVTCRRCGYNLRGLLTGGRCPECGMPIGLSTRSDQLRYADPIWVERLVKGGKYVVYSVIGLIPSMLLADLVGDMFRGAWLYVFTLIVGLWLMALWALIYYGVCLITSPDPNHPGKERLYIPRLVRIAVLIGALGQIVYWVNEMFFRLSMITTTSSMILDRFSTWCTFIASIGSLAYLQCVAQLARRIPDSELFVFARNLFVSNMIYLAVVILYAITFLGAPVTGLFIFLVGLILFIAFIYWQIKLNKAIIELAWIARATGGNWPQDTH